MRKSPDIKSTLSILADKALFEVVRTALSLPDSFTQLDIDKQVKEIDKRLKVADLQDKGKLDKFISRFAALYDLKNNKRRQCAGHGVSSPTATRRPRFSPASERADRSSPIAHRTGLEPPRGIGREPSRRSRRAAPFGGRGSVGDGRNVIRFRRDPLGRSPAAPPAVPSGISGGLGAAIPGDLRRQADRPRFVERE